MTQYTYAAKDAGHSNASVTKSVRTMDGTTVDSNLKPLGRLQGAYEKLLEAEQLKDIMTGEELAKHLGYGSAQAYWTFMNRHAKHFPEYKARALAHPVPVKSSLRGDVPRVQIPDPTIDPILTPEDKQVVQIVKDLEKELDDTKRENRRQKATIKRLEILQREPKTVDPISLKHWIRTMKLSPDPVLSETATRVQVRIDRYYDGKLQLRKDGSAKLGPAHPLFIDWVWLLNRYTTRKDEQ